MSSAAQNLPNLDDALLLHALKEILESWPLYRVFRYTGSDHSFVPEEIFLFCDNEKCGKEQWWRAQIYTGVQKSGFNQKEYTCRNCGRNVTRYYFYWALI